jgi:hypothetical protein
MSAVAQHDGSAFTAFISLLTALTLSNASLRCSASVDNRPYIEPVPGASSTVNVIGSNFGPYFCLMLVTR